MHHNGDVVAEEMDFSANTFVDIFVENMAHEPVSDDKALDE